MAPNSADRGDEKPESPKGIWALEALSFFMADVQAGLGPFLGVFLQPRSWKSGPIGAVMTIGGVAGMLVTAPAGALIDQTRRKRSWVVASGLITLLASALVFVSQRFTVVALCQCA
jgi:predicted MFS family arabinose efflux permease